MPRRDRSKATSREALAREVHHALSHVMFLRRRVRLLRSGPCRAEHVGYRDELCARLVRASHDLRRRARPKLVEFFHLRALNRRLWEKRMAKRNLRWLGVFDPPEDGGPAPGAAPAGSSVRPLLLTSEDDAALTALERGWAASPPSLPAPDARRPRRG